MFLFIYKLKSIGGFFWMNRDFLDYMNLYDAKSHLFELQTRRLDIERNGDIDELNNLDDEIVNAIIRLQKYEVAMS